MAVAEVSLKFIPHMNTKSFCYCFSSRTGCLIIGYLGITSFIIGLLVTFVAFIIVLTLSNNPNDWIKYFLQFLTGSVNSIGVVCVYYSLIQAVEKQEPKLMYVWIYKFYISLIIGAIFIALYAVALFVFIILGYSTLETALFACLGIFVLAIGEGIFYHIFSAVVTHCQELILLRSGQQFSNP